MFKKLYVYCEEDLTYHVGKDREKLVKENEALKLIFAKKELESSMKVELLKKSILTECSLCNFSENQKNEF
jgi:hypothetical protein